MNARCVPSLLVASLRSCRGRGCRPGSVRQRSASRGAAAGFAYEHGADELRDPLTFEEKRTRAGVWSPKTAVAEPSATAGPGSLRCRLRRLVGLRRVHGRAFPTGTAMATTPICACASTSTRATRALRLRGDLLERRRLGVESFVLDPRLRCLGRSDPDDDYEVETELVAGYSTGRYDVLIELYDAATGVLVDEFGPTSRRNSSCCRSRTRCATVRPYRVGLRLQCRRSRRRRRRRRDVVAEARRPARRASAAAPRGGGWANSLSGATASKAETVLPDTRSTRSSWPATRLPH